MPTTPATTLTQRQFWDDFGARIIKPLSDLLAKNFLDVLFNAPLTTLPVELRRVAGPLRAARRKELERLIPSDVRGQAKRGAFMKGVEAGVRGAGAAVNPYQRSQNMMTQVMWDLWQSGLDAGRTWANTRR